MKKLDFDKEEEQFDYWININNNGSIQFQKELATLLKRRFNVTEDEEGNLYIVNDMTEVHLAIDVDHYYREKKRINGKLLGDYIRLNYSNKLGVRLDYKFLIKKVITGMITYYQIIPKIHEMYQFTKED